MARVPVMRLAVAAAMAALIPNLGAAQRLTGPKPTGEVPAVVNLRTPQEMSTRVPFDEAALVKELGMQALKQTRMISLMDDMRMDGDRQPVERFLGRALPEIGHPGKPVKGS